MTTFVGIGFGAIQAGLFFCEAAHSGAFDRLVASEIDPTKVDTVNQVSAYALNVAYRDAIVTERFQHVHLFNPRELASFDMLVEEIAHAPAIATALPSVATYSASTGLDSPARLLAAGLQRKYEIGGAPAVIYTAENNNHAAELLHDAICQRLPEAVRADVLSRVAIVNTVISKMCGYADPNNSKQTLAHIAPGHPKALLVEAFNRILISRITFADAEAQRSFVPGIAQFVEKPDLLPFEEAKLYCHNGMHAFAAYLGKIAGCTSMAQLRHVPGVLPLVRTATVEEPGAALVRKYGGLDPLFTTTGMTAHIDDYCERMVNPLLDDAIDRVCRDPARKLAWGDRLVGAMRLALQEGIPPRRFALGAAAALADLTDAMHADGAGFPWDVLPKIWQRPQQDAATVEAVEGLIAEAWPHLEAFRGASSHTPVAPAQGATESPATASQIDAADLSRDDKDASQHKGDAQAGAWGEGAPVAYRHDQ